MPSSTEDEIESYIVLIYNNLVALKAIFVINFNLDRTLFESFSLIEVDLLNFHPESFKKPNITHKQCVIYS